MGAVAGGRPPAQPAAGPVEGRGHGKLLLFGEHAAVHGYPAVGLSLPETTVARVEPGGGRWILEEIGEGGQDRVREILALAEAFLPGLRRLGRGRVHLRSPIPRGLGFGSSAALCASLAAALHGLGARPAGGPAGKPSASESDAAARRRDQERVWELAHRAEALFHGTPSGIDTGLALLNGLYGFRPRPPALPEARRLPGFPLHLVIGAVPRARDTGALVGEIGRRMRAGDPDTGRRLRLLGEAAAEAIALLEAGAEAGGAEPWAGTGAAAGFGRSLEELAGLCRRAAGILGELGLSTPELDALLEEGRRAGALAGKPSGAGGGGAFFLLCAGRAESAAAAEAVRGAAARLGLPAAAYVRTLSWPADFRPAGRGGRAAEGGPPARSPDQPPAQPPAQ